MRYLKGLLSEINLKAEEDEFKRYKNPEKEMAAAKKGKTKTLKSLKGVSETDAPDIKRGEKGLKKAIELQKKYKEEAEGQEGTPLSAKEGVKARRRVYNLVKSGKAEPSIIRRKGKKLELVAGNSRAMYAAALGKDVKAHIYDAPQTENLNMNEMQIFVQKGLLREKKTGIERATILAKKLRKDADEEMNAGVFMGPKVSRSVKASGLLAKMQARQDYNNREFPPTPIGTISKKGDK